MFERIVAAVDSDADRSGKVGRAAAELASAFHSSVLVVHVREVERQAAVMATGRPGALQPALHLETEEEARELVDGVVDSLRARGITVEGRLHPGMGSTAKELAEIAELFDASVVIVGDRGSRVTDIVLGSVASKILHLATCPVLLVR